jgi:hypothetical protein
MASFEDYRRIEGSVRPAIPRVGGARDQGNPFQQVSSFSGMDALRHGRSKGAGVKKTALER